MIKLLICFKLEQCHCGTSTPFRNDWESPFPNTDLKTEFDMRHKVLLPSKKKKMSWLKKVDLANIEIDKKRALKILKEMCFFLHNIVLSGNKSNCVNCTD